MRRPRALGACLLTLGLGLSGVLTAGPAGAEPSAGSTPAVADHSARAAGGFQVTRRVRGLDHPWDVQSIGRGALLITERAGRLTRVKGSSVRRVRFPTGRIFVGGETGLMGLQVDPQFTRNRRIYTCQGWRTGGGSHDIRVIAWRLNKAETKVTRARTLLTGLPSTSGRHGGCRLLITRDGSLVVGTGDAAVGTNPRNLDSLGGKTLRIDRFTGRPAAGNPWRSAAGKRRYVTTFGHRNVQGLAQRRDGSIWSVEHGSFRDDEVNLLVNGGDYGWHPVPGYNEQVPMTDQSLPGQQVGARWRSGTPTIATSGASFVYGKQWGGLEGTLAVAALGGERMLFMRFAAGGRLLSTRTPAALRRFGRLRAVTQSPDGSLLVTTDNGDGRDAVLRIRKRR